MPSHALLPSTRSPGLPSYPFPLPPPGPPPKLTANAAVLRRAWESSQRVTKEDWAEWMRNFSVELLKESPSPALRACHALAQVGVERVCAWGGLLAAVGKYSAAYGS